MNADTPSVLCAHSPSSPDPWATEAIVTDHPAEGRYVYSDASWHSCCVACSRRLRGISHGPGKYVPSEANHDG